MVALAFLNSKARHGKTWNVWNGYAKHSALMQAFVAHWPGGLHPLYGTNPMACPSRLCSDHLRSSHIISHLPKLSKKSFFLSSLRLSLSLSVSFPQCWLDLRHLHALDEEQMDFPKNLLCLLLRALDLLELGCLFAFS